MLRYVSLIQPNCTVANSAFTPFIWAKKCDSVTHIPLSIGFPTFAEQMNYELYVQDCYPSPAALVKNEVGAFSKRCNKILGCEYQAAHHLCAKAATAPLVAFALLVKICFVTMVVKELAKVLCVVWCLVQYSGAVPIHLVMVVRSTPAVVLLLLRAEGRKLFIRDIVLFEKSKISRRRHFEALFVYQILLENAPQLALALYYTFEETATAWSESDGAAVDRRVYPMHLEDHPRDGEGAGTAYVYKEGSLG
jgi:hypothetical protein